MKSAVAITPVASLSINGNTRQPSRLHSASTTHAAWSAFRDGMQVLQRYACHSAADSAAIAKDNMRLLHKSLLDDPRYRQRLKQANGNIAKLSALHALLATQGLRADLITVQKGHFIRLSPHRGKLSMFMAISGKAIIEQTTQSTDQSAPSPQRKPWWTRLKHDNQTERTLRNGDVMLVSPGRNEGNVLTAQERSCVILSVSLPLAVPEAA